MVGYDPDGQNPPTSSSSLSKQGNSAQPNSSTLSRPSQGRPSKPTNPFLGHHSAPSETLTSSRGHMVKAVPNPVVMMPAPAYHRESANAVNGLYSQPQTLPTTPAQKAPPGETRNIVVFGETGVGKSSVINMIRGTDLPVGEEPVLEEAPVSSGAIGCTFSSKGYSANIDGQKFVFWDTAGLNEGMRGSVTHHQSIANLVDLLNQLGGRVHLLVYCIRGKRFRQVIKDNYDLFCRRICRGRVPIVLVVTGLENEEPEMENWWRQNKRELSGYNLHFDGHACVTATRGKALKEGGFVFDEEFEESRIKVQNLMQKCGVGHRVDLDGVQALANPSSAGPETSTNGPSERVANSSDQPGVFESAISSMLYHAKKALDFSQKAWEVRPVQEHQQPIQVGSGRDVGKHRHHIR